MGKFRSDVTIFDLSGIYLLVPVLVFHIKIIEISHIQTPFHHHQHFFAKAANIMIPFLSHSVKNLNLQTFLKCVELQYLSHLTQTGMLALCDAGDHFSDHF